MEVVILLIMFAVSSTLAADKPGDCPLLPTTDGQTPSCHDDFGCEGYIKCCSGSCSLPECEPGKIVAICLVDSCYNASCESVPDAQCVADPCSASCETRWYTRDGDVTHLCTGTEPDEAGTNMDLGSMTKPERKALWKEMRAEWLAAKEMRADWLATKEMRAEWLATKEMRAEWLAKKAARREKQAHGKGNGQAAKGSLLETRKERKEERQMLRQMKIQQRTNKKAYRLARKQQLNKMKPTLAERQARIQARKAAREMKRVRMQERRRLTLEAKQGRKANMQAARKARKEAHGQQNIEAYN